MYLLVQNKYIYRYLTKKSIYFFFAGVIELLYLHLGIFLLLLFVSHAKLILSIIHVYEFGIVFYLGSVWRNFVFCGFAIFLYLTSVSQSNNGIHLLCPSSLIFF